MFESTFIPIITSIILTPNPASAGQQVLVSVAAVEVECVPSYAVYNSGEFTSGEV